MLKIGLFSRLCFAMQKFLVFLCPFLRLYLIGDTFMKKILGVIAAVLSVAIIFVACSNGRSNNENTIKIMRIIQDSALLQQFSPNTIGLGKYLVKIKPM